MSPILAAFAGTGAKGVVIRSGTSPGEGWQRVRGTDYFVFLF